jgi:hypothetical protein
MMWPWLLSYPLFCAARLLQVRLLDISDPFQIKTLDM